MKKVLVTGAHGFIGRNLVARLRERDDICLWEFGRGSRPDDLTAWAAEADVIFHLAGVNRPPDVREFETGNAGSVQTLCQILQAAGRAPRVILSSSVQADLENPYGISKRRAEQILSGFSHATGAPVAIYRLTNVFGKWCRPNYNSVVATFCHQLARDLPIRISDPDRELELVYIDDVIEAFVGELTKTVPDVVFPVIPVSQTITLGQLGTMLRSFGTSRRTLVMPDLAAPFARKLYATFLSHLPEGELAYSLDTKVDARGSLAEFIKTPHGGQIFVSRTKPGVIRGNHYHHTKTEKFLVLEGEAIIRLRHLEQAVVLEYRVSGGEGRVVDIPPGYTHSIENLGSGEMIVLFWASEIFDAERPDTQFLSVKMPVLAENLTREAA